MPGGKRGRGTGKDAETDDDSDDEGKGHADVTANPNDPKEKWRAKFLGAAAARAAPGLDKLEFQWIDAGRNPKVLVFPKGTVAAAAADIEKDGEKVGKYEAMFWDGKQVREERSYEDDRVHQILRWICTCMLRLFPAGEEFQCYFLDGTLYLSSNQDEVNELVRNELKGEWKKKLVSEVTKLLAKSSADQRDKRHEQKLFVRDKYPEQIPAFEALKNAQIEIPKADSKGRKGFHAERRIQELLHAKLNVKKLAADKLGGGKRPCGVCAVALGLLDERKAGPIWTTDAATHDMSPQEMLQQIAQLASRAPDGHLFEHGLLLTYITRSKDTGKLNVRIDTDSDSNADDKLTKAAAHGKRTGKPQQADPELPVPAAAAGAKTKKRGAGDESEKKTGSAKASRAAPEVEIPAAAAGAKSKKRVAGDEEKKTPTKASKAAPEVESDQRGR